MASNSRRRLSANGALGGRLLPAIAVIASPLQNLGNRLNRKQRAIDRRLRCLRGRGNRLYVFDQPNEPQRPACKRIMWALRKRYCVFWATAVIGRRHRLPPRLAADRMALEGIRVCCKLGAGFTKSCTGTA